MERRIGAGVKFTVVVTVYEREYLIPRILHSLCAQKHEGWNAIFLSDGPHTEALGSVRTFARRVSLPISWMTADRRRGLWGNHLRRRGLEEATGDYVCFIGHDCLIDSDYLSTHAEAIATCPGNPLSIVQCRYWTTRDDKTHRSSGVERFKGVIPAEAVKPPENFQQGDVDLTCVAFPREAALKHGAFSSDLMQRYNADWLSFDKCREFLPVVFTPDVVCAHF